MKSWPSSREKNPKRNYGGEADEVSPSKAYMGAMRQPT